MKGEKHRTHQGANAKNFFHLLRLVVINILGVGTFVHILVTALTPSLPLSVKVTGVT